MKKEKNNNLVRSPAIAHTVNLDSKNFSSLELDLSASAARCVLVEKCKY